VPFTLSVVVGTKPLPVTVTATGLAFRATEAGLSETIAGAGFVTVIALTHEDGPLVKYPIATVITN